MDSNGIVLPRRCDFGLKPDVVVRALRLSKIPSWLKGIRDAFDTGRAITICRYLMQCESHLQREKNLEAQPGGRVEDLDELIRAGRRFGTIYMDLPWPIPGLVLPYQTMTPEQMSALPITELAGPKRCHLHLWTIPGRCQEIAYKLIRIWGFRPVADFIWCKAGIGSGNFWRAVHEPILTGVLADKDDRFDDHTLPSYAMFPRGRHSEKPGEVRRMIEAASPRCVSNYLRMAKSRAGLPGGYGIERTRWSSAQRSLSEPAPHHSQSSTTVSPDL